MSTIKKLEGFDWIDTPSQVYTVSGVAFTAGTTGTRFASGRSLRFPTSSDAIRVPLGFTANSGVLGFAFNSQVVGSNGADILRLSDGTNTNMRIFLRTDGRLQVADRTNNSLGIGSNSLDSNSWYYIEFKYELNSSTIVANTLKANNITEISISPGTNTLGASGLPVVSEVILKGHGTTFFTLFDDFYHALPSTGFLGDMMIVSIYPTGDHSVTWNGSDGNQVNNYQLVDETGNPDDDTTYVFTTGNAQSELYRMAELPTTPAKVFGIELISRVRKSGVGPMAFHSIYQPSGTGIAYTGLSSNLGSSFSWYRTIVDKSPTTLDDFTPGEINLMNFGQKSQTGVV